MYSKLLCLALAFVLSLTAAAEDLQSVIGFYKPDMSRGFIYVSKVDMTLTLVNSRGKVVVTYPIACGMNIGQKSVAGDHKTPEGYFLLQKIHDASNWGHDFHDGKGFIPHAYGPWFLRLQTGFQGIGIHGTHAPASIGTRATEGCIRLRNSDVEALEQRVVVGMPVIIGPEEGVAKLIAANAQRPDLPYWTTGGAPRPSRPAPAIASKRKPKVVDGVLDIDPEKDLADAVQKPSEPIPAVKAVEPAAETPAVPVVEIPAVEPSLDTPVAGTPAGQAAEAPANESPADQVAEASAEPTDQAPRYEVVVEEVTQPDGTVKFEVRYVRQ